MADNKTAVLEREYTIPLRRFWMNVPEHDRGRIALRTIKRFIAKHMKVADRDTGKVKVDVFLNNTIWYRGKRKPPARVKVKAKKEGEIVTVTFVEEPQHVKRIKARLEKRNKAAEKKPESKEELKPEAQKEQKTEEQKTEEKEKEQSTAEFNAREADKQAKVDKHTSKPQKVQRPQRMALQK